MAHIPRNWPFVREIHRTPVNSPQKYQWRGALMFPLICIWINDWVNNREAGDLRRYRNHFDVIVMTASLLTHRCVTKIENLQFTWNALSTYLSLCCICYILIYSMSVWCKRKLSLMVGWIHLLDKMYNEGKFAWSHPVKRFAKGLQDVFIQGWSEG